MPESRITWIDSIKAFSIMAVVLYHTQCIPEIKNAAYLLCLPAFFFCAGLCANTAMLPKAFFKKKTLRLLIPYILWGILSWSAWLLITYCYGTKDNGYAWWYPLAGIAFGRVDMLVQNRPLWFLCCMITLEWLYYLLCFLKGKGARWAGALCIGGAGCILSYYHITGLWEITAAMLMLPIYVIGAEVKEWWKTEVPQWPAKTLVITLSLSIIGVCIGYHTNPQMHISTCIVGNPFLFYFTEVSVIGVWLSLALLINRYPLFIQLLQYIGRNTLLILCAHIPVFGIIKGIALLCNASLEFFTTPIGCLCLWSGTFILLVPASELITRFCPILLGKRRIANP